MTRFVKFFAITGSMLLLLACSSVDKQRYDVTTIQSVGLALLELADDKRQLGQYEEALVYYIESEKYALKRNDKLSFGLSQLKRAAVHLKLDQPHQAKTLIDAVDKLERFEPAGLANSLLFVRAQYQQYLGNTEDAVANLSTLQNRFATQPEKQIYYQFVSWVYLESSVPLTRIAKGYDQLAKLKADGLLYNIEIFSYAILNYGKYLTKENNDIAERVLMDAIDHFSMLEQSNKIAESYLLLSTYFGQQDLVEKSEYYRQQAERITSLKVL